MKTPVKVIAYDVGTTGLKTCLFEIGKEVNLIGAETADYKLYILDNGGAEQDPLDWWAAMCSTTRKLLLKTKTDPAAISGISFCSQMQGLVLVDRKGHPLRRELLGSGLELRLFPHNQKPLQTSYSHSEN